GGDQGRDLFLALYAVYRRLHVRIEVLHAKAQAIEAQRTQVVDTLGIDGARIDLDGKLVGVAVIHVERLVQAVHQIGQLFAGQIGRGAAAEVQLGEDALTAEQLRLHGDFTLEVIQVFHGAVGLLGDDLVAGA